MTIPRKPAVVPKMPPPELLPADMTNKDKHALLMSRRAYEIANGNNKLTPPEDREYPLVMLKNGLVSMETTPDYLVEAYETYHFACKLITDKARVQLNARESPLLRLLPEIRNTIFAYAMGGHTVGFFNDRHIPEERRSNWSLSIDGSAVLMRERKSRSNGPAFHLPEVCRQIYTETATLGYAMNTFILPKSLNQRSGLLLKRSWLSQRNDAQRSAIVSIEPSRCDAFVYHRGHYLRSFSRHLPSLRKIYINMYSDPFYANREGLRCGQRANFTQTDRTHMKMKVKRNECRDLEVVFRGEADVYPFDVRTWRGINFYRRR
jgi:hypothetical protein